MNLSHPQKNYIKKNIKRHSISEISQNINVSEEEIRNFLKKSWKKEKYEKLIKKNKNINPQNIINPLNIKKFIKENKFYFLILLTLVIVPYANSLGNGFVSDDKGIVATADTWNLEFALSHLFSVFRLLPYLITYKLFGLNPVIFRLGNIFFHLGTVWLIYLILSILTKPKIGFLIASIFAVHPILIESVAWISGGAYAQYSFFFLLAFLFYLLAKYQKNKRLYFISITSFLFSLLSFDKAGPLFLVFIFFELSFGNLKKNWKNLLPYASLSLIFITFYIGQIGPKIVSLQTEFYQENASGLDNPLIKIPIAITSYLELIFWPKDLTLYHSELSFAVEQYWIRLIIFLIFCSILILGYKKNRQVFFWLSFFVITLAPTLTPLRIGWVVAERYVYLGSLGIFAAAIIVFEKLTHFKKLRTVQYLIFALIILILSIRTIVRNVDWQNEDNLGFSMAKTSPSSPNTHNNLGDVYSRNKDYQNAVLEFKKAIEIKPNYADAYHNLGNAYRNMGKTDDALKSFQKAVSLNPRLWQSYQNIAAINFSQNEFDLALENLKKAIAINPKNADLHVSLGIVYFRMGDKNKTKEMFRKALEIDPDNQAAKTGLSEMSE